MSGCELHKWHAPKPLGLVVHHVWPKGMSGPDTPENKVIICAGGHLNTHRCLDDLLAGRKPSRGTRSERALAQRGYDAWVAAGKPGRPVYETTNPTRVQVSLDGKAIARAVRRAQEVREAPGLPAPAVVRTIVLRERKVADRPLGRHVHHDERSRAYAVTPQTSPLVSVRHKRHARVFDQGQLGSCTGNACAGALSTAPFPHRFTEKKAVAIYSAATQIDNVPGQWPPTDTGSDGLSVAKVAKSNGWCSSYQHCFSLDAVLTALQTGPVMLGVSWRSGFDNPTPAGQMLYKGSVRGGHEICADEIDVENKRVWITNSWGSSWSLAGRAWWSFDDLGKILADNGDATVLVP